MIGHVVPVSNYYIDLVITPANVAVTRGSPQLAIATDAITRGDALYKADSQLKLADASAQVSARLVGIALADADPGQYCPYLPAGSLDVGAALTVGEIYVVSATAGGIAPIGDLLQGEFLTIIGVAVAADKLVMVNFISEIAMP